MIVRSFRNLVQLRVSRARARRRQITIFIIFCQYLQFIKLQLPNLPKYRRHPPRSRILILPNPLLQLFILLPQFFPLIQQFIFQQRHTFQFLPNPVRGLRFCAYKRFHRCIRKNRVSIFLIVFRKIMTAHMHRISAPCNKYR